MIKVLGWERKNNAIRVDFVCGKRALTDYQVKHHLVQETASKLSVPVKELAETFSQRLAKLDSLTKELTAVRTELSQAQAAALLQTALQHTDIHMVAHCLQDAQPNDAAQLAKNLTATVPAVAFIAAISPGSAKAHLVFATNTDKLDMGKLLKAGLAKLNGKGGGSPRLAQGGTNSPDKLQAVLSEALLEAERLLDS
jgi:alanyl-tRNA synthetase